MNDNLRYISLQYIKGNNYEKVTCFDIEGLKKVLELKDDKIITNLLFNYLEKTKKSKCEIGESLLDDLINYIEFKGLIPLLTDAKVNVESKKNKEDETNISKETSISKELKKLFSDLTNLVKNIEKKQDGNKKDLDTFEEIVKDLVSKLKDNAIGNYDSLAEAETNLENAKIDLKNAKLEIAKYKNTILNIILKELQKIKDGTVQRKILNAKNILKYFNLIYELLSDDIIEKKASKKRTNEDYDKLIKLYNKYIYICNNNIKKYEKIFEYNEIDNIDDAFMIASYSKFLKKLRKIKESLQSKDIGKIERNLINFLDKFFHLHGFNPENIKDDIEINYLVQRILNYT